MMNVSRIGMVALALVAGTLVGGCSSGGGGMAGSNGGAMTASQVRDINGGVHDLSELEFTGGRRNTQQGEEGAFKVKKSTVARVGDGLISTISATLGGWGGTKVAEAAGGGNTGQIVGGVGGGAAGAVIGNEFKTDPNQLVWCLLNQPGLQQFAMAPVSAPSGTQQGGTRVIGQVVETTTYVPQTTRTTVYNNEGSTVVNASNNGN